jgi:hypothetical protein
MGEEEDGIHEYVSRMLRYYFNDSLPSCPSQSKLTATGPGMCQVKRLSFEKEKVIVKRNLNKCPCY